MYFLLLILFIVIIYIFVCYNSISQIKKQVVDAYASVDVFLKRRFDLIPTIIQLIKTYQEGDQQTIIQLQRIHDNAYNLLSMEKKLYDNQIILSCLPKLLGLAVQYPTLKQDPTYIQLYTELQHIDSDMEQAGMRFNELVTGFDRKLSVFPYSMVASLFHVEPIQLLVMNETIAQTSN